MQTEEAKAAIPVRREGPLAVVTIHRPERRNALTFAMWRRLAEVFEELEADEALRGVVLTGAGGVFSAGGDITEFDTARDGWAATRAYEGEVDRACDAIAALSRPVVAAVEGPCYGGACHLAMACDFRIASPDARFAIPAAKLSVVYSARGMGRLLALVGLSEARRILYGGEPIGAERALEQGLVDEVAPSPLARALDQLTGLAERAPLAIAAAKLTLNALAHPAGAGLDPAALEALDRQAVESRDYAEARQAFREKRPPRFEGR